VALPDDPESVPEDEHEPVWLYVLAGFLLAWTELSPVPPPPSEAEIRAHAPFRVLEPSPLDPDLMNARELKRLPSIGPARALAIAQSRWEQGLRGGPQSWEAIPGIGPETVRAVRSALDREAAARAEVDRDLAPR
jgi:hypothetical protein